MNASCMRCANAWKGIIRRRNSASIAPKLASAARNFIGRPALTSPASHFIRSFRLEKARQLLASSRMTIAEVAHMPVGFKDPYYFSRTFARIRAAAL